MARFSQKFHVSFIPHVKANSYRRHLLLSYMFLTDGIYISCSVKLESDIYGGPQLLDQIQITHIKYKILTSNTNYSHQKQIAHIKYRLLTSNTKS